jgi:hypothetical protein
MYTVLGTLGIWFADKDSMYSNPPLATFAVTFPRVLGDPMAFPRHFQEGLRANDTRDIFRLTPIIAICIILRIKHTHHCQEKRP